MDVITEAFREDPFINTAFRKLKGPKAAEGPEAAEMPFKFVQNHIGRHVIQFHVLEDEFEDWLMWHSDTILCQFILKGKAKELQRAGREGELS
ncbi:hypothetical protein BGX31_007040, partial [Mortierella sp. GBA43]